jgi:hypothetical protein
MIRIIITLLNLVLFGCASQAKCSPSQTQQQTRKLITVCNPENRVLCYDRERVKAFTDWCKLGHLQITSEKLFNDNLTVLVCDEGVRVWKYIIPFDQVCEIFQETVCKAK